MLRLLVGGPDLRPEVIVLGCDGLRRVVAICRLTVGCVLGVMPGIFFPQHSTCSQSSRASLPNTQKNRKMKKPWSDVNMVKRIWKTTDASRIVKAPNNHVSPYRAVTPVMLINVLMTVSRFAGSLPANFLRACLMSTLITMTNMTRLKSMMTKMGARKALKNVAVLERKQLEEGM